MTAEGAAGARTFLIADIRGYTAYTAERGDDAAAALANRFAELCRDVVEAHEGFVIELRGDEALCAFVSARQALRAALALQQRFKVEQLPRGVGIGIDSGEAIPVEGGFRGTALNLAARLCAQAKPGQIIASEAVIHLAARVEGIAYIEPRTLKLKGYDDPVRAVDVVPVGDVRVRRTAAPRRPAFDRRFVAVALVALIVVAMAGVVLSGAFSPRATPGGPAPSNPAVALGSRSATAAPSATSSALGSIAPSSGASPLASEGPIPTSALPLLAFLDPQTGQISSTQSAPPGLTDNSSYVDGSFWQLGLTPAAFYRIDPETHAVTATVPVPANNTGWWTVDKGTIWLSDGGHLRLIALDANTGTQIHDYTLWQTPDQDSATAGVAVGAGSIWVVANDAGKVFRVDPATGGVQATIDVPNAYNIAFGNGAAWTTGSGDMSRIDPATNEVTFTTTLRQFQDLPWMTFSSDAIWTADSSDGTVFKVDRSGNIAATYNTGAGARPLQFMDGKVWVANQDGGTVSAIDATLGTVQTFEVGHQVTNLAAGGGQVLIGVQQSTDDVIAALPGNVLVVAMTNDVLQNPSPDPATNPYIYDRMILYATCSRLLDYGDEGGADSYQLRPEVAAEMPQLSPDGLTYTFTIKPGFKFSPPSSEEITAETYRFSMERALSEDLGDQGRRAIDVWSDIAGAPDFHDGKADHVSGLQAAGDQLMVTLTAPSNDFLQRLMLPYSCPVPLGTPIVPSLDPNTPVPTTGPYYLAAHGGGEYAILKPNPNYGGSRQPGYDAIVLRFGLSDGDTVQFVNNGRAGMAIGATTVQPTSDVSTAWGPDSQNAASGDQRWYGIPYPGVDHLLLNPNGKLTSDPVVRRAIALALDRAAAGQSFLEPPATTILNKSVAIQDPEVTDLIGPDATTAKADLAGKSGTIRFAIPKNCSGCLDSANSIKSNLAAVGLTLDIVQEDSPFDAAADPRQRIDMIDNYAQPFYPDAAQLLDDIVSGAPQGWFNVAQQQQASSLLALAGTARDEGAADFAQQLTSDATVIPYGGSIDGVYFSPSVGCRTIIAGIMNVDLTALCPAAP